MSEAAVWFADDPTKTAPSIHCAECNTCRWQQAYKNIPPGQAAYCLFGGPFAVITTQQNTEDKS